MAKEGIKELYSLYCNSYFTLEPGEIIIEINRYFRSYQIKVETGEFSEEEFLLASEPFFVFNMLIRKKYDTFLDRDYLLANNVPFGEAYNIWLKTGKTVMKRGLSEAIKCSGSKRDALEWIFEVMHCLKVPASYFSYLGIKKEFIPAVCYNYNLSGGVIRWFLTDPYEPNLKELWEKGYDVGDTVELTFHPENGETYRMVAVIEKAKLGDYYCRGYIENYTNTILDENDKIVYVDQIIHLRKFAGGYRIFINETKITPDMSPLDCMLGNLDFPVPGEKWTIYNKARMVQKESVKDEYVYLRTGTIYGIPDEFDDDSPGSYDDEIDDDDDFEIIGPYEEVSEEIPHPLMDKRIKIIDVEEVIRRRNGEAKKPKEKNYFSEAEEEAREARIDELMKKFDVFRLSEISKNEIRGYFRYLLTEREIILNYHFLVQTDADSYGRDFAKTMVDIVNQITGRSLEIKSVSEYKMLTAGATLLRDIGPACCLCIERAIPNDRYYPTDDISSSSKEERTQFDSTWEILGGMLKDKLVFMFASKEVSEERMKNLPCIYYRFFRHHIHLNDMNEEEVCTKLLEKFRNEAGELSEDFEGELRKYIYTVYPKADLKNQAFVDNLYDWMIALAYRNVGRRSLITKECIPYYHKDASFEAVTREFEELVGLEDVKEVFEDIALVTRGLKKGDEMPFLHMFFYGNPGTGKTTVARRIAKLFASMGIIKNSTVHEVSSADLIAQYIGQTGPKVRSKLKQAANGVLFIDEAYALNPNTDSRADSFRNDCITELIKAMDRKTNPIVIFSGYPKEMESFKNSNPGLASRIGYEIRFKDYDNEQLLEIFKRMCEHDEFGYDEKTIKAVERKIVALRFEDNFGNARTVENIYIQAKTESLRRNGDAHFIAEEDIVINGTIKSMEGLQEELDNLVGIVNARKMIKKQILSLKFCKEYDKEGPSSNNMIFVGNPGTGKTTVARLFSEMLFSIGAAKSPRIKMITAKDLFVSDVAQKMNEYVNSVMGGVLFIDEIYMIEGTGYATGVVSVLLEILEERKEDITIILAGYEKQMDEFLGENSGLKSRFPITVHFEDFTEEELLEIFVQNCEKAKMTVDEAGKEKFREVIRAEKAKADFGNGRTVRNLFEEAFRNHSVNYYENGEKVEENVITACDIEELSHANEKAIKKMGF